MRKIVPIDIPDPQTFKKKLVSWARSCDYFLLLDSNTERYAGTNQDVHFEFLAAFGMWDYLLTNEEDAFERLDAFFKRHQDWLFGHFSYDLKNGLEKLVSRHPDEVGFPALYFFQPKYVVLCKHSKIELQAINTLSDGEIQATIHSLQTASDNLSGTKNEIRIHQRFERSDYLQTVQRFRDHIKRGDIYEVNFCQEFYSRSSIDPYVSYQRLNHLSPSPFAAFYKLHDKFLLSSSPERFLKKDGEKVISQPIKGTIKRGRTPSEDDALKNQLLHDVKEQAENVMIVDLVRNDLARTAKKGTVHVEELFGVYTFEQVHQLISTVAAEIDSEYMISCIQSAFPMGSMTGAPKVRAMELIEEYERTKRGLYSGSVGYFSPDGNFDFNVIIRSILYNSAKKYVSYSVGGAITYLSEPEKEYEECMVKARAMKQVLNG